MIIPTFNQDLFRRNCNDDVYQVTEDGRNAGIDHHLEQCFSARGWPLGGVFDSSGSAVGLWR